MADAVALTSPRLAPGSSPEFSPGSSPGAVTFGIFSAYDAWVNGEE